MTRFYLVPDAGAMRWAVSFEAARSYVRDRSKTEDWILRCAIAGEIPGDEEEEIITWEASAIESVKEIEDPNECLYWIELAPRR